jgi:hypothetical protein
MSKAVALLLAVLIVVAGAVGGFAITRGAGETEVLTPSDSEPS